MKRLNPVALRVYIKFYWDRLVLVACLFQSGVLYEIPLNVSCSCFQPNLNLLFSNQKGHFKGMLFHKVIKHYVIQAGHNKGPGALTSIEI